MSVTHTDAEDIDYNNPQQYQNTSQPYRADNDYVENNDNNNNGEYVKQHQSSTVSTQWKISSVMKVFIQLNLWLQLTWLAIQLCIAAWLHSPIATDGTNLQSYLAYWSTTNPYQPRQAASIVAVLAALYADRHPQWRGAGFGSFAVTSSVLFGWVGQNLSQSYYLLLMQPGSIGYMLCTGYTGPNSMCSVGLATGILSIINDFFIMLLWFYTMYQWYRAHVYVKFGTLENIALNLTILGLQGYIVWNIGSIMVDVGNNTLSGAGLQYPYDAKSLGANDSFITHLRNPNAAYQEPVVNSMVGFAWVAAAYASYGAHQGWRTSAFILNLTLFLVVVPMALIQNSRAEWDTGYPAGAAQCSITNITNYVCAGKMATTAGVGIEAGSCLLSTIVFGIIAYRNFNPNYMVNADNYQHNDTYNKGGIPYNEAMTTIQQRSALTGETDNTSNAQPIPGSQPRRLHQQKGLVSILVLFWLTHLAWFANQIVQASVSDTTLKSGNYAGLSASLVAQNYSQPEFVYRTVALAGVTLITLWSGRHPYYRAAAFTSLIVTTCLTFSWLSVDLPFVYQIFSTTKGTLYNEFCSPVKVPWFCATLLGSSVLDVIHDTLMFILWCWSTKQVVVANKSTSNVQRESLQRIIEMSVWLAVSCYLVWTCSSIALAIDTTLMFDSVFKLLNFWTVFSSHAAVIFGLGSAAAACCTSEQAWRTAAAYLNWLAFLVTFPPAVYDAYATWYAPLGDICAVNHSATTCMAQMATVGGMVATSSMFLVLALLCLPLATRRTAQVQHDTIVQGKQLDNYNNNYNNDNNANNNVDASYENNDNNANNNVDASYENTIPLNYDHHNQGENLV